MSSDSASLYRIHGLLVKSELALHAREVDRDDGDRGASPDYTVVEGETRECPFSAPPGRILAENSSEGFGYWAVEAPRDPRRWMVRYGGICDVLLDRGRRTIAVNRSPEADPGMIPIFVEGSVLAHALAAHGLLAFHGSAVEAGGRALAIVGGSGAGKSTLAALLCAAGARLVADDVLRVDPTDSGAVCFPGSCGLRLRPAAAGLGPGIVASSVGETADGRTVVLPASPIDTPLEVAAVLVPTPSHEAKTLEMRRLEALEGLQQLLRYPRLTRWQVPERIARPFELTAKIADGLPVYTARVPWGPPFPPRLADELLSGVGLGQRAASA